MTDKEYNELQAQINKLEEQIGNLKLKQSNINSDSLVKTLDKFDIYNVSEVVEKSITTNSEKPTNLLIEGDNSDSLTYLATEYTNKIDIIYIDPPYNTGHTRFKYNDQFEDEKNKHKKWLVFMEERLRLSLPLLKDSGVIFISIDDNELYRLKVLCDDIFGEDNFIANLIRKTGASVRKDSRHIAKENDYVLCYAKNIKQVSFNKDKINVESDKEYKYEDKYIKTRGKYKLNKLDRGTLKHSQGLFYTITAPDGTPLQAGEGREGWCWRWSEDRFKWGVENDFIHFKQIKGKWSVYFKQYQYVNNKNEPIVRDRPFKNLLLENMDNERGSKQLLSILGKNSFHYPKPVELISYLLKMVSHKDSIVLDFFAGSGTTGQAVLELNQLDKGNRQFILCTNNENNICEEVTYERLKKVIEGYTNSKEKYIHGLDGNLKYYKVH